MKFKKFAKMSLAVALVFGTTITAGCKKDDSTSKNEDPQYEIYQLAVKSGETELTYEEWLITIRGQKGDKGDKGDSPEITIGQDGYWYIDGVSTNVKARGESGINGTDGASWTVTTTAPNNNNGKNGDFHFDKNAKKIYHKVNNEWVEILTITDGINGTDGKEIEFNQNASHILWRYKGTTEWNNLVSLNDLKAQDGKQILLQTSNTHIQWKYEGDAYWTDLIEIEDLKGADGKEVEFQKTETHIQWRYKGTETWFDLVDLNSLKGENGTTWKNGEGDPNTNSVTGKIGDFYFDTLNDDIYICVSNNVWEMKTDLESVVVEESIIKPGKYVYESDIYGYDIKTEITFDDNLEIVSFVVTETQNLEDVSWFVPVSVNGTNVTLARYTGPEMDELIVTLNPELTYNVNHQITSDGIVGTLVGKVTGELDVVDSLVLTTSTDYVSEIDSYNVIDDNVLVITSESMNATIAYKLLEKEEYTPIKQIMYISEEDGNLIYGSYKDFNGGENYLTISKSKALFSYNNLRLQGTIDYLEGNVEEGYVYATFTSDTATFNVLFDLYTRTFEFEDGIHFNFVGEYISYDKTLTISKENDEYVASINGEDVTFEVINTEDTLMYASITINDEINHVRIDMFRKTFEFMFDEETIVPSIEENISLLNELYDLAPGTDVTALANDNMFYTAIGYSNYPIHMLNINNTNYDNNEISFSVGNNNFITKKAWFINEKTGKIYIASSLLKGYILGGNGNIVINGQQMNFEEYKNTDTYVNVAMQADEFTGVYKGFGLDANESKLEPAQGNPTTYNFSSTNGKNSIRIYLGTDSEIFENQVAFVIKEYNGSDVNAPILSSAYSTLDKIDGKYYLVFYPSYFDGDYTYEESKIFTYNFTFVLSNGMYGMYTFNIELSNPNL